MERHLLVQCRRRRGIRLLQPLHRSRILVDFKMGIRCQRASQRPLAGSDCLPDRTFHRCALAELIVYSAIVLVYYYKKNPDANLKGSLLALTGSMVLVAAVLYGIVRA